MASAEADQALVDAALSPIEVGSPVSRQRVSDATLQKHMTRFIELGLSATSALRELRSEMLLACEERRFRRLYQEMLQ